MQAIADKIHSPSEGPSTVTVVGECDGPITSLKYFISIEYYAAFSVPKTLTLAEGLHGKTVGNVVRGNFEEETNG